MMEAALGIGKRARVTARRLASLGLLALPACSALNTDSTERLPPPPLIAARTSTTLVSQTAKSPIVQASALMGVSDKPRAPASANSDPRLPSLPDASRDGKPLPIDLPTALALANANPLDIQIAGERLKAADAALARAKLLWLPNIDMGVDYFRHDGQIQDIVGNVFTTSRSSFLVGAGPTAVFSTSDAYFGPLAARQLHSARQADAQATRNDTTLQVAETYFTVQQARGEVAAAIDTLRRAEELVRLTEKVAPDLAPTVEIEPRQNRVGTAAAGGRDGL